MRRCFCGRLLSSSCTTENATSSRICLEASLDPSRSRALACLPHLLARPLPSPLERDEGITGGCIGRGPHLDQVLHFESRRAQQAKPVAVRKVKLDARIAGP